MARHVAVPGMTRRRGNPNWGSERPLVLAPALPTEFEVKARNSWDSQPSFEPGASKTGIGPISQNGYLKLGISP
jgi:hypothetical protein